MSGTGKKMETIIKSRDIENFESYGERYKSGFTSPMSRIKSYVKELCNKYERATKDDLYLYLKFLSSSGEAKIKIQKDSIVVIFNKSNLLNGKITKPETVSRARRSLKKDNEISYDDETAEKRLKREEEFRVYYHRDRENESFEIKQKSGVF